MMDAVIHPTSPLARITVNGCLQGSCTVGPMTDLPPGPLPPIGAVPPLNDAERAVDDLLSQAHLLAAHQLPALVARHAARLGVGGAVLYLADLQQDVLVPFLGADGPAVNEVVAPLAVDGTMGGRAYQHVEILTQDLPGGGVRVWLPLLDGSERLGVLMVTVSDPARLHDADEVLLTRLRRFAALAAELVMTKTLYADTIVQLRRRAEMGLAAEMQWSLLPPLTFSCHEVTVAAALEPAYEVAGDTVDYAVDSSRTRVAVFDGMGHGLRSAQLAALAVAAYRNARRTGRSLTATAQAVEDALVAGFAGDGFTTAVLGELHTDTGRLEWINAGHPEPLLLRDGKLVKTLRAEPGPPLGLGLNPPGGDPGDPDGVFIVGVEQLEPGDRVLFYTDGVIEARSPDGDLFGVERLVDLLIRNLAGALPTPETMRRIVRALLAHQQGQLSDDATLLLLEWRSCNEEALLPTIP
jgi:serine phosphatase RsbU (regulator of sigma subunit)